MSQHISESTRHPVHGDTLSYIQRLSTESGRCIYNVLAKMGIWTEMVKIYSIIWGHIAPESKIMMEPSHRNLLQNCVQSWQWNIFDIHWRQDALPEDHQQSRPDSTSLSRRSPRCTHTQHCSRTAVMEECCKVFNIDLWQMHHLLVHNSHSKWRRCPKLK